MRKPITPTSKASSAVSLTAVESKSQLRQAHRDWAKKFSSGTARIPRKKDEVFWAEGLRFWARFAIGPAKATATSFRTYTGLSSSRFSSPIVEINLPYDGDNSDIQGIVAIDGDGDRWVLHHGRMHVVGKQLTHDDFAAVSGLSAVSVKFKSGEERRYFAVTNIDATAEMMRSRMRDFVRACERVKAHHTIGADAAEQQSRVDEWERGLFPETSGSTLIPAQPERQGRRWHGDVSNALVKELKQIGCQVANERVGIYGPDLYTACKIPKLFEIKTGVRASDIHHAIGQLYLYECFLGRTYQKVLVVPTPPSGQLAKALAELDIRVLGFTRAKAKITFDANELKHAMT